MHAPHFGGLWEAVVNSFKKHLKVVVGEAKLTFEELSTWLTQKEAWVNSRPLTPLPEASDERPIASFPDHTDSYWPINVACTTIAYIPKVNTLFLAVLFVEVSYHPPEVFQVAHPARDIQVNDVVCLCNKPSAPTKWPLMYHQSSPWTWWKGLSCYCLDQKRNI